MPQPASIADASASPISVERIAAFPPPGWQIPRSAAIAPDGSLVTYLQSESQSDRMVLYAFDRASGAHRVLVRAEDLVPRGRQMSREEELRRERLRTRIKGVTAYAWADQAKVLLLPLGGDVFVRKADGSIEQLTRSPEPDLAPALCADGSKVAFVRSGELYVVDVQSGEETQLTRGRVAGVTRGLSDFNAQEEFDEPDGFWWSPRCDALAYLEVDERQVGELPIFGYRDGHDLQTLRYPRAGTENPSVRLGLRRLDSKQTRWIELPASDDFDSEDQYIGRVHWARDGRALYLQRLSRSQQHLALVRVDPQSGKATHLVHERDDAWLELSDMRPVDGDTLLWTALRDGHRHLELRHASSGELQRSLTSGAWDVAQIVGVDQTGQRVLFIANKDAVLDRQLYAVPLAGGPMVKLGREPGVHHVSSDHPQHGWIDIHSALDRAPRAVIVAPDGKHQSEIPIPKPEDAGDLGLRVPQIIEVPGPDGVTLHGALLTPRAMLPGVRYPALVVVYGGPGVQRVRNMYDPRLFWQHLADRGVVVFQLDNRGTAGRGHAFQTPIHRQLGRVELADQLRGLEHLCALPFVDASRVGIYGHSYGGYVAAMAMLRAPGRFSVAVSASPVTDWALYDSGYTERYLGTPQDNPEGYAKSALAAQAGALRGKLLLVHSLMDENVHFEHTAKLIDALVEADKDFDLLVFPGERHGYRSEDVRRYVFRRIIEYLVANL